MVPTQEKSERNKVKHRGLKELLNQSKDSANVGTIGGDSRWSGAKNRVGVVTFCFAVGVRDGKKDRHGRGVK